MNAQFKKGVLELCVLALIRRRDYYGYELVAEISERIETAEGTMYPILRRLAAEGLCETYLQESSGGPPRKYYRITEKGAETIAQMAGEWNEFYRGVNELLEPKKSKRVER